MSSPSNTAPRHPTTDDFIVGGLIAAGSFGRVFAAGHKPTRGIFALKIISRTEVDATRLEGEATLHYDLKHPHVMPLETVFLDELNVYLVMPLASGSLEDLIEKKDGPLTENEVAKFIRQMADGLAYLHGEKILHRDIKPANMLLSHSGDVMIADFGLACVVDREPVIEYVGSDFYASPESKAEGMAYSYPADLWSLGITVLEMVAVPLPGEMFYCEDEDKKNFVPEQCSAVVRRVLLSLLDLDPTRRLSAVDVLAMFA